MKLTAIWAEGKEPYVDVPASITWEDGRRGTPEDMHAHAGDTRQLTSTKSGCAQMHIYPEITAEVYYCPFGHVWGLRGDGVQPTALPITDPGATDLELQYVLLSLPVLYRVNIVR